MDKWHIKCQGGMEFMILVGVLLFMLTIMMGVVSGMITDINREKEG